MGRRKSNKKVKQMICLIAFNRRFWPENRFNLLSHRVEGSSIILDVQDKIGWDFEIKDMVRFGVVSLTAEQMKRA